MTAQLSWHVLTFVAIQLEVESHWKLISIWSELQVFSEMILGLSEADKGEPL